MKPIVSGDEVHVDELPMFLTNTERDRVAMVIDMAPPDKRVATMLAFLGLDQKKWAYAAGLSEVNLSRWLRGVVHLPFGAAVRLAKVLGVHPAILFEYHMHRDFNQAMTGQWLTVSECARLISVSRERIRQFIKQGRVDWSYTVGGALRVWSASLWRSEGEPVCTVPDARRAPPEAYFEVPR